MLSTVNAVITNIKILELDVQTYNPTVSATLRITDKA